VRVYRFFLIKKKNPLRSHVLRIPSPAQELGKHGITVNAYAPGGVETRLRQSYLFIHEASVLTCRWTVDQFDEFLEPLAGPRAGRNGVSATNSSSSPATNFRGH
jgi:NAD(P)-dependent dehydrogenase (short-subunit alcohol dehydrogenase family)